MRLNAPAILLILQVSLFGCSATPDSDAIGPRPTEFNADVTFAVCTTAEEGSTRTIDRQDPVTGEILHLTQPPVVTMRDVKGVSIMEAPGQWPIVTVTFDRPTAERFSREAQAGGGTMAILINDEILFASPVSDKPITKLELRSVIGGPDIRACVR
jgi:hypothetical protein